MLALEIEGFWIYLNLCYTYQSEGVDNQAEKLVQQRESGRFHAFHVLSKQRSGLCLHVLHRTHNGEYCKQCEKQQLENLVYLIIISTLGPSSWTQGVVLRDGCHHWTKAWLPGKYCLCIICQHTHLNPHFPECKRKKSFPSSVYKGLKKGQEMFLQTALKLLQCVVI